MKVRQGCRRVYSKLIKINQNHPLRFLSLPNTNLDTKNFSDERLKTKRRFLRKNSTSVFCHEIAYIWLLKPKVLDFAHKNRLGMSPEMCFQVTVTSRFFNKCQCYPMILWLQIWGHFDIRNSIMSMKIDEDWPLRVYTSIVQKMSTWAVEHEISYLRAFRLPQKLWYII